MAEQDAETFARDRRPPRTVREARRFVTPLAPEQSARRYVFHMLYGMMQAPMLVVMTRLVRRTARAGH
jgi:hypothetical protein